jgi:hypothetical protein
MERLLPEGRNDEIYPPRFKTKPQGLRACGKVNDGSRDYVMQLAGGAPKTRLVDLQTWAFI